MTVADRGGQQEKFVFSPKSKPAHRPADHLADIGEAALDEALSGLSEQLPDPTRDVTGNAGGGRVPGAGRDAI